MATLKDLFSVSRFYDLTFLTDHSVDNLSGHVESIEISETPDINLFIPERIILLTTAMIFKNKQKDMPEYLDRLKGAKVAALGIKTGRFLEKLDQSVIDHANKIDLPIFFIPDHYSLGSLLHQFSNLLWEDERNKILYAFDVQRNFAELLYKEADFTEILDLLSKNINSPVVLFNHFLDLRATSSNFSQAGISEKELVANLILEREKTKKNFGTFLLQLPDGRKKNIYISKVSSNDYFPNYLVILNADTLNYPVNKFIISQTILVLKFTLFKEKQIYKHNQTKKQDMFYEMLRYIDEDTIPNRNWIKDSRKEFLNISNYYQVILVQIDINNLAHKTARYLDELKQNIDEWLAIHLENYLSNTIYFKDNSKDMFIIFIQDRQGGIEKQLNLINDDIKKVLPVSLRFFQGLPVREINEIKRSYIEAELVLSSTKKFNKTVYTYRKTTYDQLFNQIDIEAVDYFCESILKDFAYPKDQYNLDLRNTLKVYLDNQCEISNTAKKMFIHRNTVIYRIERCEEVLGMKINTPENSMNLRIALALSEKCK